MPKGESQIATEAPGVHAIQDDGERMIPDFHHDAVVYAEHMVRYIFASRFVRGKRVLDVASGVGYGSNLLKAAGADQIVGIDYSEQAVRYGAARHAGAGPDYVLADAECLPLADAQFDIIVSFETIEHVPDPQRFLCEVKRVLRPDGLFIVSTPNRGIFVEGNPFHLHEFTFAELEGALNASFSHVATYTQDDWITSAILARSTMEQADTELDGRLETYKAVGKPAAETLYMVSLCSDALLPQAEEHAVMTGLYEMKGYLEEVGRLNSLVARLETDLAEQRELAAQGEIAVQERVTLQAQATRFRRELRVRQGELEGALRRLSDIESSVGWRALNRLRPIIRKFAPRGSLRYRLLLKMARTGMAAIRMRPLRTAVGRVTAPLRTLTRRRAVAGQEAGRPRVRRLRVGCYGEHCWSVGGGTVHALQLIIPLAPYYDVDLLLPPGTPLRDAEWYRENLRIDIGDVRVRHYSPGVEDTYDVWLSVWNERIWPARTPKRFNMVFFPFVSLDGSGYTHIANSQYTAGYLKERYNTQDIVVIPPCIEPGEFETGPKEPMILHVSRFSLPSAYADKAHVMMIQAFKQLCERGLKGWRLVLAGATIDEGEEIYAAHLAKHAHGFPVEFALNLPAAQLRNLFTRASVYWHATGFSVKQPAAQEHFGITILEAMASGAVPVVYNSGGPPEIITSGQQGYLFDSLDELVDRTWSVAADPRLWKRLSQAARERARYFSPARVRSQMLSAVSKTEKASIIIGTHNNLSVLKRALESVLENTPPGYELIVVDNGSGDGTAVYLASLDYPHLRVIRNRNNHSFAAFNNQGQRISTRPYILYLNDDIEAFPGWIEPLIETLDAHPKVGAVGSRLLYPDGRVQHDGKMFHKSDLTPYHINMGGRPVADESPIEVDALTGACMLVRRELAGFDTAYRRGYYEDTDLCIRIKENGYALVLHRGSVLIHHHGVTMGRNQAATEEAQKRNRGIFLKRWAQKLPGLVYLASDQEMAGTEIRCRPVLAPEDREERWPLSQRLEG